MSIVVPEGPADGVLRTGDVLVSVNGDLMCSFVDLEAILDGHVNEEIIIGVERGSQPLTLTVTVQDLHSITPSMFCEISHAILHPTSYQQARNYNIPVNTAFIATSG